MEDSIKSYYLQYKAVFDANFKIVLDNFDMEAIHKMRTSTKRLRALFQLIEFVSVKKFKAKKQLKKIRSLFKHAGKIREIQIEYELVTKYEAILNITYPAYKEYLKLREHKEIAAFLKSIPRITERDNILKHNYILKTIDTIPADDMPAYASDFINWKKKQLTKLNAKPASNHRIHTNRTYIKQLYYLFHILTSLTGQSNILNRSAEQLRAIEQLIGSWHDLVNSAKYLNAFFNTKNGEKTKEYIQLRKRIAIDRKSKRKEIVGILGEI
jgi:CHAD domain-containing protein